MVKGPFIVAAMEPVLLEDEHGGGVMEDKADVGSATFGFEEGSAILAVDINDEVCVF